MVQLVFEAGNLSFAVAHRFERSRGLCENADSCIYAGTTFLILKSLIFFISLVFDADF